MCVIKHHDQSGLEKMGILAFPVPGSLSLQGDTAAGLAVGARRQESEGPHFLLQTNTKLSESQVALVARATKLIRKHTLQ